MSTAARLANEARALFEAADRQNRALTSDERVHVEDLLERAQELAGHEKKLKEIGEQLGGGLDSVFTDPLRRADAIGAGPGDVFVKSAEYQRIKDPAARGQSWSTGPIKVSDVPLEMKGTLTEPTAGGPGGGLIPAEYQPGVVQKLFAPLTVADLLPSSPTTASQMRYVVEGTADNQAAGVAEGGVKPESALGLSEVIEPIRKIATVLPVTDELLEDAASIQAYLNGRLSLFVKIEEERQILRGSGTNELVGIFNRTGAAAPLTYGRGTVDNNAVAILRAAMGFRGSVNLDADLLVMHPDNWLSTRLLTDNQAQFYGGGPFEANANFAGVPLWGIRTVLSPTVGKGTALLGSSQAAQVWRRGGVTLDATNSHADFYVHDLSMLRAEERLGLGVYRPFVQVTGLA